MKRPILLSVTAIVLFLSLSGCEKDNNEINGPSIETLSAQKGLFGIVTLFGRVSNLNAVALNYECGIEYSTDENYPNQKNTRIKANVGYSENSFSITASNIITTQKYYYRAYYISDNYIHYGDSKSFIFEWDTPNTVTLNANYLENGTIRLTGLISNLDSLLIMKSVQLSYGIECSTSETFEDIINDNSESYHITTIGDTVTCYLRNFQFNTNYYYRTFIDIQGIISYGEVKTFIIEKKEPEILTLNSEKCPYYVVKLFGSISDLEAIALDFQCGFEYSMDDCFSKEKTVRKRSTNNYSEEPFTLTIYDIIPGQKYYYRAYYINQQFIYYGEVKSFATDEWAGPEAVDLGLSVKWADMNVDAYRPWERGNLYSWGELEPKESYKSNNYRFYHEGTMKLTKYCNDKIYGYEEYTDTLTTLEPEDDVAHVKWGGDWRIPSKDEFLELMDTLNCEWIYTSMNGMSGYKVQSKKNDNFIFMPDGSDSHGCGGGLYWANCIEPDCAAAAPHLYFNNAMNRFYISTYIRDVGLTIRAVCP